MHGRSAPNLKPNRQRYLKFDLGTDVYRSHFQPHLQAWRSSRSPSSSPPERATVAAAAVVVAVAVAVADQLRETRCG